MRKIVSCHFLVVVFVAFLSAGEHEPYTGMGGARSLLLAVDNAGKCLLLVKDL